MSGETEKNISGWTTDTLKEYFESVVSGNDKRYQQRFDAQEAANLYARAQQNEFRGALQDVGEKQMPRTEAEALFKAQAEKVDALQARMDRTEGRSGGIGASWGWLVGAVGLVGAIIAIFIALKR